MPGFCGSCGAPRVDGAKFCTSCGTPVVSAPEPCPTCGQMWTPPAGYAPATAAPAATHAPAAAFPAAPTAAVPTGVPAAVPPAPGLPRGPLPGEDYRPGLDCGNCGMELEDPAGRCTTCGTANVGADFRPGMLG